MFVSPQALVIDPGNDVGKGDQSPRLGPSRICNVKRAGVTFRAAGWGNRALVAPAPPTRVLEAADKTHHQNRSGSSWKQWRDTT